jgi:hypothetical protein
VSLVLESTGEVGVYLVVGVVWSWNTSCGLVQARSLPSFYLLLSGGVNSVVPVPVK